MYGCSLEITQVAMKNPSKPKSFTISPMKNSVSLVGVSFAGANLQSIKQQNVIFTYFHFKYIFLYLKIYIFFFGKCQEKSK